MKTYPILLTAICPECQATVGHDMQCPCSKSIKLKQIDSVRWKRSPKLLIEDVEEYEILGYTH